MHVVVVHTEEPRLCDRAVLGVPCSASGHGLVKLLELERKAMYLRGFPRYQGARTGPGCTGASLLTNFLT